MADRYLEPESPEMRARWGAFAWKPEWAAKAEAAPQINPHHPQPGRRSTTRPWGDVIARTFRQKG